MAAAAGGEEDGIEMKRKAVDAPAKPADGNFNRLHGIHENEHLTVQQQINGRRYLVCARRSIIQS